MAKINTLMEKLKIQREYIINLISQMSIRKVEDSTDHQLLNILNQFEKFIQDDSNWQQKEIQPKEEIMQVPQQHINMINPQEQASKFNEFDDEPDCLNQQNQHNNRQQQQMPQMREDRDVQQMHNPYTEKQIQQLFSVMSLEYLSTIKEDQIHIRVSNQDLHKKITLNYVSTTQKIIVFQNLKEKEKSHVIKREMELSKLFPFQEMFTGADRKLTIQMENQILTFQSSDLQKLKPKNDLNDTLIENYFKILKLRILPQNIKDQVHFFSPFFVQKLIGVTGNATEKGFPYSEEQLQKVVNDGYPNIRRWNRNTNIFQKSYLVFPFIINNHWNCLMVIWPNNPQQCRFLFLDSMFQMKSQFSTLIKLYLKKEMKEKCDSDIDYTDSKVYQLLLPRQTNNHDCGVFILCYVQYLLKNQQILRDIDCAGRRNLLENISRTSLITMRQRMKQLILDLLSRDNRKAFENYEISKQKIEKQLTLESDFDIIDKKYFEYYLDMYLGMQKQLLDEEMRLKWMIKYYLDMDVHYVEQDPNLEDSEVSIVFNKRK